MNASRARLFGPVLGLSSLALCGVHPSPDGGETTIGAGTGHYEVRSGGCVGTRRRYEVGESMLYAQHRHTWPSGVVFGGEATVAPGVVVRDLDARRGIPVDDDVEMEKGDIFWTFATAARLGWRGAHAGFEFGPAALVHPSINVPIPVLPSGEVWVGRPDVVYAWASLLSGPTGGAFELDGMLGLGHASPNLRLTAGGNNRAVEMATSAHIGGGMRLGLRGATGYWWGDQIDADTRLILEVGIDHKRLRAQR